jgi:hypothetical protein
LSKNNNAFFPQRGSTSCNVSMIIITKTVGNVPVVHDFFAIDQDSVI